MNIDIINSQVSKNLNHKIEDVKLVNSFYWRQIYNHLYSYDPDPINIENICVLYPNKYSVKNVIQKSLRIIHNTRISTRYKEGSVKKNNYLADMTNILRKALNIRKQNKFYN